MSDEQTRIVCDVPIHPPTGPNFNMLERKNSVLELLLSVDGITNADIPQPIFLSQGTSPFASLPSDKVVFFPTSAVVSAHLVMRDGTLPGVSIIGYDGSFGRAAPHPRQFFRVIYRTLQAGYAVPISADIMQRIFKNSAVVNELHEYMMFTIQLGAAAAYCVARHNAESRIARWISAIFMRSPMKTITATHENIGDYLCIRRESVTESLRNLAVSGALENKRGSITVRNPQRLIEKCCPCYSTDKAWLDRWPTSASASQPPTAREARIG